MCSKAINQDGLSLEHISDYKKESKLTFDEFKQICALAIEQNILAIEFVPEDFIGIYHQALKKDWRSLKAFSEKALKKIYQKEAIEKCKEAIKKDWREIQHIPTMLLDLDDGLLKAVDDACRQGVQVECWNLDIIPEKIRNDDIYLLAIDNDAEALRYVPIKQRTYNVCFAAVMKDIDTLRWIMDPVDRPALTNEEYVKLCQAAITKDKKASEWVHESVRSELNQPKTQEKNEKIEI